MLKASAEPLLGPTNDLRYIVSLQIFYFQVRLFSGQQLSFLEAHQHCHTLE